MKRLLPLVLFVALMSCSSDDESGDIMQELAATISVELPEYFEYDRNYDIEIVYRRPSNCHVYSGLDVSRDENEITIGVVTSIRTSSSSCANTGNLQASAIINFVAERDDFYIFRFWQGQNAAGRDEFLIVEVPVTMPGID